MAADNVLPADQIAQRGFTVGFRGFDQVEVREFLGRVAEGVRTLQARLAEADAARREAEERAARPPVLDEDTLMAAVGEETAAILRTARAAAAELRSRAEQETARAVDEARVHAAELRAAAEARLGDATREAEEAARQILEEAREKAAAAVEAARAEAAAVVEAAQRDADALRTAAEEDRRLTIEGATATREKILADLSRRRRVATVQIEQLRAGRERLLESYGVVRRTLEEVNDELQRADAEARAAADETGRRLERELPADGAPLDEPGAPGGGADAAGGAELSGGPEPVTEAGAVPGGVVAGGVVSGGGVPGGGVAGVVPGGGVAGVVPGGRAEGPVVGAEAADPAAVAGSKVDELFARIRAAQPAGEVDEAGPAGAAEREGTDTPAVGGTGSGGTVLAAGAGGRTATGVKVRAGEEEAQVATPRLGDNAEAAVPGDEAGLGEVAPAESSPAEPAAGEGGPGEEDHFEEGSAHSDADEALLQQRDRAVADLEVSLTRKLKRALQDEQNDLLDRLRGLRREPTAEALLPAADAQAERLARAARPLLAKALDAGAALTRNVLGLPATRAKTAAPALDELAAAGAAAIAEPLRRRLEHAIEAAAGDEQQVLVEAIGAAYREWKSQRVERLAGDVLAEAFARGTWRATPDGTPLRWIVEDLGGPCPDCDDDGLAGALPKGEEFPTGQLYPPAHSGCRCLLVPVPS